MALENEIWAYATCRIEMALWERPTTFSENRLPLLREPSRTESGDQRESLSAYAGQSFEALLGRPSTSHKVTQEMFEQFSLSTGIGSEVLVGSGPNLASIVFYVALHAAISAERRLTREQVKRLLFLASECVGEISRFISTGGAPDDPSRETQPKAPGRRKTVLLGLPLRRKG